MTINQFAVYQVREEAAYRPLRFRSYDELLQKGYRVDVSNYHQVYLSQLAPGDTAETICGASLQTAAYFQRAYHQCQ